MKLPSEPPPHLRLSQFDPHLGGQLAGLSIKLENPSRAHQRGPTDTAFESQASASVDWLEAANFRSILRASAGRGVRTSTSA